MSIVPRRFPASADCSGHTQARRKGDLNVIVYDAYLTAGDLEIGISNPLPGFDAEFPAVPRTLDDGSIQLPFTQRTAGVRTGIVDGVERPVDIKEGYPYSTNVYRSSCSRRNVMHLRNSNELVHRQQPPRCGHGT